MACIYTSLCNALLLPRLWQVPMSGTSVAVPRPSKRLYDTVSPISMHGMLRLGHFPLRNQQASESKRQFGKLKARKNKPAPGETKVFQREVLKENPMIRRKPGSRPSTTTRNRSIPLTRPQSGFRSSEITMFTIHLRILCVTTHHTPSMANRLMLGLDFGATKIDKFFGSASEQSPLTNLMSTDQASRCLSYPLQNPSSHSVLVTRAVTN